MGFPSGWAGLITLRPRGSDLRAPNGLGARLHKASEISLPSPPWGVQTDRKPETRLGIGGRWGVAEEAISHALGRWLPGSQACPSPMAPATGVDSRVDTDSLEVTPVDNSSLLGPLLSAQKKVLNPNTRKIVVWALPTLMAFPGH